MSVFKRRAWDIKNGSAVLDSSSLGGGILEFSSFLEEYVKPENSDKFYVVDALPKPLVKSLLCLYGYILSLRITVGP